MHAFTSLPSQFRWTAQQLADAIPLRLHQHRIFSTEILAIAANDYRRPTPQATSYLPAQPARSHFRIL